MQPSPLSSGLGASFIRTPTPSVSLLSRRRRLQTPALWVLGFQHVHLGRSKHSGHSSTPANSTHWLHPHSFSARVGLEWFFISACHVPGPVLITKAEVHTRSRGPRPAERTERRQVMQCGGQGAAGSAEVELNRVWKRVGKSFQRGGGG